MYQNKDANFTKQCQMVLKLNFDIWHEGGYVNEEWAQSLFFQFGNMATFVTDDIV